MNDTDKSRVQYVKALLSEAKLAGAKRFCWQDTNDCKLEVEFGPVQQTIPQFASSSFESSAYELQRARFITAKAEMEMMYAHTGGGVSDEEVWLAMGEVPLRPRAGEPADEAATVEPPEPPAAPEPETETTEEAAP